MFGFNYYTPTKVVFGKGTESRVDIDDIKVIYIRTA